ncbi:GLPGLI family protein [Halosquirtibacter laminarini]|uniref:GLPGLI family protein n=1 Tax=Halosquirtibacter laminarini TaxID=3374600 RepID=A0AC61NK13_9BACT|nr:GLPGLI family protein [Prolixibacteraceae bacterium]
MKNFVYVILLWISYCPIMAQEYTIIDTTKVNFYYDYTFVRDTTDLTLKSHDDMVLQVGEKYARFSHTTDVEVDSALYLYRDYTFHEQLKLANDVFQLPGTSKYSFYRLYKNYPKKSQYSMDFYSNKSHIRIAEPIFQSWNLEEAQDTTIMGYRCSMATCHYAGRDYRAWYTLDIPISMGPYKFDGLPGLVVRVEDSEKQHVFQLYKIGKRKRKIFYVKNDKEIKACSEELSKIFYQGLQTRYRSVTGGKVFQFDDQSYNAKIGRYILSHNNFIERY